MVRWIITRPDEDVDISECNIGTKKNPKFFKLSSNLSREQRAKYAELLNEFADVLEKQDRGAIK